MNVKVADSSCIPSCLSSCTKAALAGGVTMIGAMPNTHPSITNREALDLVQTVGVRKEHFGL